MSRALARWRAAENFDPHEARIAAGHVGAGRWMKLGTLLKDATEDEHSKVKRPTLLKRARLRGIALPRGVSDDEIRHALRVHDAAAKAHAPVPGVRQAEPKPVRAAGVRVRAEVRVEGALVRWAAGEGTTADLFTEFEREPLRIAAKNRGLKIRRGASRDEILSALKSDVRGGVRRARDEAKNPPIAVGVGAPIINGATRYHRDVSDVSHLIEGVRSGIAKRKMANQGMVGETWIETYNNGVRAIHKWSKRDWAGADAKTQADAEQLASLLGRAIDAPVPAVYRHNDTEIYMDFIQNAITGSEMGIGRHISDEMARTPQAIRLGLLDLLASNMDRHGGNYMVDRSGRVWGIDHGLAWAPGALRLAPASQPPIALSPFSKPFVDGLKWSSNSGLTLEELRQIRDQVMELKPDFEQLGRGRWHEYAVTRLDRIIRAAEEGKPRAVAPRPGRAVGRHRVPAVAAGVTAAAEAAARDIQAAADRAKKRRIIADQRVEVLRDMLFDELPWHEIIELKRDQLIRRVERKFGAQA